MSCTDIAQYDFYLTKGDDEDLELRYKADGIAVDITDYVMQFVCTEEPTLDQDATIVDAIDGRFDFVWDDAVTAALSSNRVSYHVIFWPTGLTGDKFTYFEGSITILEVS